MTRLPTPIPALSEHETEALQEIEALAEDLALHGDPRAGVALAWIRCLLGRPDDEQDQ